MNLRFSEWDRELYWARVVEIDWSCVWRGSPFHTSYHLLFLVAIVDVGCEHPGCVVVASGDVEGIETEGSRIVREVGESRVVVLLNLFFSMVVDRLFYHLNSGCSTGETLEHGDEVRIGYFTDHVGGWDYNWGRCGDMDG